MSDLVELQQDEDVTEFSMDAAALGDLLGSRQKEMRAEWSRLEWIQRHIDGRIARTWMPEGADAEYKDLLRKASTPWLQYARNALAQGLFVDGFSDDDLWKQAWQANSMDGRQIKVNREVVGLGKSYGMALPGENGTVVMRPMSALHTFAHYADPWDEYPEWALYRTAKRGASYWDSSWYFFDRECWYRFTGSPATPQNLEVCRHDLGFCPVVQLSNTLDSDDAPESSIEAGIKPWKRIVDYTFTLSMVMRYGAFPQKWMAGGEIATDDQGNAMIRPSVDSLLHASGDSGETARFGSFQAANIADVVTGLESAKADLSAVLQIPPHYFMSKVINMSADGIEAEESPYFRNLEERKASLSEGYELWMRTAADVLGKQALAQDTNVEVHWLDQRTRSLAQVVDAIVKLKTVGAPDSLLFAFIPGWTKQDVLDATASAARLEQSEQQILAMQATETAAEPAGNIDGSTEES
ncbi:MAG: phage portal protein [Bifidobacterium psychraerophilum]|jgi:hypothetical protein|uniref:phage portal protein n=1 Tax=Bifidobacterium psychraerophilum TaxID=218140 RepID=UPI0039EB374A